MSVSTRRVPAPGAAACRCSCCPCSTAPLASPSCVPTTSSCWVS